MRPPCPAGGRQGAPVFHLLQPRQEVPMRLQRALAGFILIAVTLASPPVLAGQHVLDATQLAAVLNGEVNTSNAERAPVPYALALPPVRRIASALAIDDRVLHAPVETMPAHHLEHP